jgi:hypothetical protein
MLLGLGQFERTLILLESRAHYGVCGKTGSLPDSAFERQ